MSEHQSWCVLAHLLPGTNDTSPLMKQIKFTGMSGSVRATIKNMVTTVTKSPKTIFTKLSFCGYEHVTSTDIQLLLNCSTLSSNIRYLQFSNCQSVDDDVVSTVLNHFTTLEILEICDCGTVTASGFTCSRTPRQMNLKVLRLIDNPNLNTDDVNTFLQKYTFQSVTGAHGHYRKMMSAIKLVGGINNTEVSKKLYFYEPFDPTPALVLRPCTYLMREGVHYVNGLFTTVKIPKGTYLTMYAGYLINKPNYEDVVTHDHSQTAFYVGLDQFFTIDGFRYPRPGFGMAQFSNCSKEPNCILKYRSTSRSASYRIPHLLSTREIDAGEELTISYGKDYWRRQSEDIIHDSKRYLEPTVHPTTTSN